MSACIHHLFEQQADLTPSVTAIECGVETLSYQALNERSNQLAHFLRRQGVGPEVLVGICLERTPDLIVGILGILKAGGAYVPIDLAYPKDRVAFMLSDSKAPILLTRQELATGLSGHNARLVCLDADAAAIAAESPQNPADGAAPENLAYVIYTSGSTGNPKGSLITHRNVVRLFEATAPWFKFSSADVWTLFHSAAFDFSVWEIWGALFYGGRLVIVPFGVSRSPEAFYRLLCTTGVTVLNQTPSAFRQLIRAEEAAGQDSRLALRIVVFGGEALDMKSLQPWFARHGDQHPRLINMYGITETTVHVTYRPLTAADVSRGSVIGEPIPDLRLYVLDDKLRPILPGATGEICVGGAGLGRGYLNRPDLTDQKFVSVAFGAGAPERLYRSGDLGRFLPNGDLEYIGRSDHQVKIRGFRIELGEIEAVLNTHASVRESVVLPRDDQRGEKQLVAYVISRGDTAADPTELRQLLRGRLPEYMVPAAFVAISQLPLTTNGKLDVHALPAPGDVPAERPPASAINHGTPLQNAIVVLWQNSLRRAAVGLDDNFFDLGGNSLSLAEIHQGLQTFLGREIPITLLFTHTTIRSLSAYLDGSPNSKGANPAAQNRAQRQREAQAARRGLPR